MRAVVRFWIAILSVVVSLAAVGYLFLSFLSPGAALVFETQEGRIAVTFLALVATGTLVWSTILLDSTKQGTAG